MVDIHCHILPGVDDGSDSWETTLEMCRLASADGITHVVATPHANDEYAYDRQAHELLLQDLKSRAPSLQFTLGCDFHMSFENIEQATKDPHRFTIGNTDYILVEFNDFTPAPQMTNSIFRLRSSGVIPIVTHPERNPQLQCNLSTILQWAANGCVIQVTAGALLGKWGNTAQRCARFLLDHSAIHVIASDGHETRRRKPELSAARQWLAEAVNDQVAEHLSTANPAAILQNLPLPYFPKPKS